MPIHTFTHTVAQIQTHTCNAKDRCEWVSEWERERRENGIYIRSPVWDASTVYGHRQKRERPTNQPTDRSTTTTATHTNTLCTPVSLGMSVCMHVNMRVCVSVSFCLFCEAARFFFDTCITPKTVSVFVLRSIKMELFKHSQQL